MREMENISKMGHNTDFQDRLNKYDNYMPEYDSIISVGLKFYCECCDKHQLVTIDDISKDKLNKRPWGDVVCKECSFVIVTISAKVEGMLIFEEKTKID